MQIQIEIISVSVPQTVPTKNGKSYQAIEVAYKKDGKIEGKKIMSFTNPSVFKAVQTLSQGEIVFVTTEKNDAGYWQWEGIEKGGAASTTITPPAAISGGGTSKSYNSNYETKEEREVRQVMIVRQSSIASAVNLLGSKAKASDVITVAKEFESYVMETKSKSAVQELLEMEDNIPL